MSYTANLTGSGWLVDPIINPKNGLPSPGYQAALTGSGWVVQPIPKPAEVIQLNAFDPASKSALVTMSEGDSVMTSGGADRAARSLQSYDAGKRYFEVVLIAGNGTIGVGNVSQGFDTWVGSTANSRSLDTGSGNSFSNSQSAGATGTGVISPADVVGVAVDLALRKAWFSKAGAFGSGQDPVAGTGGFNVPGGAMFALVAGNTNSSFRLRTIASQFTGSAPVGFNPWGTP